MNFENITLELEDGIATLALNRPEKRNAMNDPMRSEFIEAMEYIASEVSIRALVLTGKGKGFCAGGDIAGMEKRLSAPAGELAINGWRRQLRVHHAIELLYSLPKPTIAAVNGPAAGLGADTALACDFIMASDQANFAWSYILRGIIPDGGGMYFLPRRVGLAKAKELIFSGRKVTIEEALQLGIVDRVTSAENLLTDAQQWARDFAKGSAAALALSKTILNQSFETPAHNIFASGAQAQGICYTSTEHKNAVAEFLQKSAEAKKG
jgi:enoyl-CoA hydratase/carnithine racemase